MVPDIAYTVLGLCSKEPDRCCHLRVNNMVIEEAGVVIYGGPIHDGWIDHQVGKNFPDNVSVEYYISESTGTDFSIASFSRREIDSTYMLGDPISRLCRS